METTEKVRIGVTGLTHDHVNGILRRPFHPTYVVVAIAEEDTAVSQR